MDYPELPARLRATCEKLRRTPMAIADVIPMMQEAANALDAQRAAPVSEAVRQQSAQPVAGYTHADVTEAHSKGYELGLSQVNCAIPEGTQPASYISPNRWIGNHRIAVGLALKWMEDHGEVVFAGGGMTSVDSMGLVIQRLRTARSTKPPEYPPIAYLKKEGGSPGFCYSYETCDPSDPESFPVYDDKSTALELSRAKSPQPVEVQPVATPAGFALVPLRPTQEMEDVFQQEGWQWEDILAASGAITSEEYDFAAAQLSSFKHESAQPVALEPLTAEFLRDKGVLFLDDSKLFYCSVDQMNRVLGITPTSAKGAD